MLRVNAINCDKSNLPFPEGARSAVSSRVRPSSIRSYYITEAFLCF